MLLSCCGMATLSRGFLHGLAGEKAQPFVHPLEAELDCCSHQGPCSPLLSHQGADAFLQCQQSTRKNYPTPRSAKLQVYAHCL